MLDWVYNDKTDLYILGVYKVKNNKRVGLPKDVEIGDFVAIQIKILPQLKTRSLWEFTTK